MPAGRHFSPLVGALLCLAFLLAGATPPLPLSTTLHYDEVANLNRMVAKGEKVSLEITINPTIDDEVGKTPFLCLTEFPKSLVIGELPQISDVDVTAGL